MYFTHISMRCRSMHPCGRGSFAAIVLLCCSGLASAGIIRASALAAGADGGYAITDLTPPGYNIFPIGGIGGGQQVGTGSTSGNDHPLLWRGSAASVVDLIPAGYAVGDAYSTDGTHQVGIALKGQSTYHAYLWSGTAASAVDLTPNGYSNAFAVRLSGNTQIGWATPPAATRITQSSGLGPPRARPTLIHPATSIPMRWALAAGKSAASRALAT